jgi:glycerol uptake facilitator-like aquaporin
MFTRQKIGMILAEFLGTAILTLTVLSVSVSNIGIGYFIALAAGLAVVLLSFVLGPISGAIFNPALTIGLWTIRRLQTYQAIVYLIAQVLGGFAAYYLFMYMSGHQIPDRSINYESRVFVAEIVGSIILAVGFAAATLQKLLSASKAVAYGGAYALGIMIASVASAAYLNPAVALGTKSFELVTYLAGPVVGAVIGMNLYKLLFADPVFATDNAAATTKQQDRKEVASTATTAKRPSRTKTSKLPPKKKK